VVRASHVYLVLLAFLLALLLHTPSIAVALLVTTASGLFIYRYSLP
jgi:hypothetical protein